MDRSEPVHVLLRGAWFEDMTPNFRVSIVILSNPPSPSFRPIFFRHVRKDVDLNMSFSDLSIPESTTNLRALVSVHIRGGG